jgi:hypothetical protein
MRGTATPDGPGTNQNTTTPPDFQTLEFPRQVVNKQLTRRGTAETKQAVNPPPARKRPPIAGRRLAMKVRHTALDARLSFYFSC